MGAPSQRDIDAMFLTFAIVCGLIGAFAWWFLTWIWTHLSIAVKWS